MSTHMHTHHTQVYIELNKKIKDRLSPHCVKLMNSGINTFMKCLTRFLKHFNTTNKLNSYFIISMINKYFLIKIFSRLLFIHFLL